MPFSSEEALKDKVDKMTQIVDKLSSVISHFNAGTIGT